MMNILSPCDPRCQRVLGWQSQLLREGIVHQLCGIVSVQLYRWIWRQWLSLSRCIKSFRFSTVLIQLRGDSMNLWTQQSLIRFCRYLTPTILDIDECSRVTHSCSPVARCKNLLGSFQCECSSGYAGDGFHCTGPLPCYLCFLYIHDFHAGIEKNRT